MAASERIGLKVTLTLEGANADYSTLQGVQMVRVGTFNLNNLFSRFNFRARVGQIPDDDPGGITVTFDQGELDVRTFMGRLVDRDLSDRWRMSEPETCRRMLQKVCNRVVMRNWELYE